MGKELGVFCSVGVFPLPLRATLSHSSKRSYSPLLKRAVVLWNRRVGERRLESSRLVCPGTRFLPINWDWQGLSVAGSLALVPAVHPCDAHGHACFCRAGKPGCSLVASVTSQAGAGRCWPVLHTGLWTGEGFSIAFGRAWFYTLSVSSRSNSSKLKRKALISSGAFLLREPFLARGAVNY